MGSIVIADKLHKAESAYLSAVGMLVLGIIVLWHMREWADMGFLGRTVSTVSAVAYLVVQFVFLKATVVRASANDKPDAPQPLAFIDVILAGIGTVATAMAFVGGTGVLH
jgi:hypothetical protein